VTYQGVREREKLHDHSSLAEEAVSMAISGHGGQYAGMYGNPGGTVQQSSNATPWMVGGVVVVGTVALGVGGCLIYRHYNKKPERNNSNGGAAGESVSLGQSGEERTRSIQARLGGASPSSRSGDSRSAGSRSSATVPSSRAAEGEERVLEGSMLSHCTPEDQKLARGLIDWIENAPERDALEARMAAIGKENLTEEEKIERFSKLVSEVAPPKYHPVVRVMFDIAAAQYRQSMSLGAGEESKLPRPSSSEPRSEKIDKIEKRMRELRQRNDALYEENNEDQKAPLGEMSLEQLRRREARTKEILREVTDIAEELENQRREYRAAVEHEAGTRNALFGVSPRRGSLSIRV
jgi:hypothetical protein